MVLIASIIADYKSGRSLPQVTSAHGLPISKVRDIVKEAGSLRSRTEGVRIAATEGRLGGGFRGKTREFSETHKQNISEGRRAWAAENAKGTRINSNGYIEFTCGPHKGRAVHDIIMEERIGRRLLPDEEVHHIDLDRQHNHINNLALLTNAGHMRLHRLMDKAIGKDRRRGNDGRFC
jgi:hypothetical protein